MIVNINLSQDFPEFVGISSTGDGTISPINPPFVFYKGSNAIFDLSDSSLSYTQSATSYPAFNFDFYKDQKFNEIYETSGSMLLLMFQELEQLVLLVMQK